MAADSFQQSGNADGQIAPIRDARLRVPHSADLPRRPGLLGLVRGRNSGPRDGGTSGMVSESVYDSVGHVPEQFRRRSRRHRRNGRISGRRPIFTEHGMGAAVSSRLHSFILSGSGFLSRWTRVSHDRGSGPEKS